MPFTWSSFTLKEYKRSYIGQDAATNNETIKNHRIKYWKIKCTKIYLGLIMNASELNFGV